MTDQVHIAQNRVLDSNGDPVPGALVNVYASGTLARLAVFLDTAGTVPTSNPVVADANGVIPQIFVAQAAKIIVQTAAAATLYTLDPAPLSQVTGSAATLVGFDPTSNVPFSNVQDAIEGVDASLRELILAGGAGVTADAPLLAALDSTTTAGGAYRFASTTTGTFPTGVVAADTGLAVIWRQSATLAVMELYALSRVFRRVLSTTWGAWQEIIAVPATATRGAVIQRGETVWEALAKGTAGQALVMNADVTQAIWAAPHALLGTITTASGTSASLTGLVLTPYKFLRFAVNAVSGTASFNMTIDITQCAGASGSAAALLYGFIDLDLSTGVFSATIGVPGSNFSVYAGITAFTNASTEVFVGSSGADFDGGTVRVYGIY